MADSPASCGLVLVLGLFLNWAKHRCTVFQPSDRSLGIVLVARNAIPYCAVNSSK
jgi:hypothetical protein